MYVQRLDPSRQGSVSYPSNFGWEMVYGIYLVSQPSLNLPAMLSAHCNSSRLLLQQAGVRKCCVCSLCRLISSAPTWQLWQLELWNLNFVWKVDLIYVDFTLKLVSNYRSLCGKKLKAISCNFQSLHPIFFLFISCKIICKISLYNIIFYIRYAQLVTSSINTIKSQQSLKKVVHIL